MGQSTASERRGPGREPDGSQRLRAPEGECAGRDPAQGGRACPRAHRGATCSYRGQVRIPSAGDVRSWLTTKGALRVPQITAMFWVIKGLSTAMGEATSDYLVHAIDPVPAVLLGFCGFVLALALQFRKARYSPWTYWFAVAMVGVFGTMAADVLHVGFGVPYGASTTLYAVVLVVVFVAWERTEKTMSIHTIDTPRREAFYWATVVATFAMGTALGDLTAYTLGLGYFPSAILFASIMVIPAVGYRWLRFNPILSFWFAYVVTRPLARRLPTVLASRSRRADSAGAMVGWRWGSPR
jgi:uncharacterized membrane-anchored protein